MGSYHQGGTFTNHYIHSYSKFGTNVNLILLEEKMAFNKV
jgi:hypothetical protein